MSLQKFSFLILLAYQFASAQADCKWEVNVKDSLGSYKETKSYLMYERIFDGKQTYLSFRLVEDNEMPLLRFELVERTKNFSKAVCFDKSSRLYLQLQNGKIVNLLFVGADVCSDLIATDGVESSRILTANFAFPKGSLELLSESPVILMRIKYTTETADLIIKKSLKSELMNAETSPESFFSLFLPCFRQD